MPGCRARGRRSRRARSGGRTRRRSARACRAPRPRTPSRSRPRARPPSRRRSAAAVRARARAWWDRTLDRRPPSHAWAAARGVGFGPWSRSFRTWVARSTPRFPAASRHPLRALDQRRWSWPRRTRELRAALFRFVDVTPACRSLDDLARHLAGYLEEVDDRPPPIDAAMRMSGTKPGRAALGAAAAAGVRHMAHRFIVGETPEGRAEGDPPPVGARRGGLARPAGRGDGHRGRGGPLRRPLPGRARDAGRGGAVVAGAARARGRLDRAAPAREPVGEGVRAHAAAAPRGAGRRPRRRRAPHAPAARAGEGARRPPAHRHGVRGHARGDDGARVRAARRARSCATAPRPAS